MEAIFAYFFCGIIPRLAAPLAWGLFRRAFVSIRLAQPIETRANRTRHASQSLAATLALRRGRIVDRSPRAADVPEMKCAGLVAAVIQPLVIR
jgi:hypothetical protein